MENLIFLKSAPEDRVVWLLLLLIVLIIFVVFCLKNIKFFFKEPTGARDGGGEHLPHVEAQKWPKDGTEKT